MSMFIAALSLAYAAPCRIDAAHKPMLLTLGSIADAFVDHGGSPLPLVEVPDPQIEDTLIRYELNLDMYPSLRIIVQHWVPGISLGLASDEIIEHKDSFWVSRTGTLLSYRTQLFAPEINERCRHARAVVEGALDAFAATLEPTQ